MHPPPRLCQMQAYRDTKCKGRTRADQSVLNDTWVLFPTTSTSENFVAAQKNAYEQALFKCEDERYELDMGMCMVAFLRERVP